MTFGYLNYLVLLVYLGIVLAVGAFFTARQRTTEDYFLAGRNMPWLAVAMSMYASLTSAVTYMGLPGMAYKTNIALIVVCFVSPLLAPILILVFYKQYRKLRVTTSYEFILHRFGSSARASVSALFLLARLGWLGVVVFAPALALAAATGIPLTACIIVIGLLATFYTVLGGMAAVLWTDVVQFVILIGGAIWIAASLIHGIPGGLGEIIHIARETDHLALNWNFSLVELTVLGVAVSFFLQMMQDYGTDQVTVQRLMATKTDRGVAKAILFNACTDFFILALLLFIGLGLFAHYTVYPAAEVASLAKEQILPFYIMHAMPAGVSGLMIAAIFAAAMSSVDSGINSMATVIVNDFVKPLRGDKDNDQQDVKLARGITCLLGMLATGVAFYVSKMEGLIEAFATFMSLFNAPVLALFLLGMLTRRATFGGWCVGTAVAIPLTYVVQQHTAVSWVYYFPLSFIIAFGMGLMIDIIKHGCVRMNSSARTG